MRTVPGNGLQHSWRTAAGNDISSSLTFSLSPCLWNEMPILRCEGVLQSVRVSQAL